MFRVVIIFLSIVLVQACAVSSGINGEFKVIEGHSYSLDEDKLKLVSSRVYVFPAGTYQLEAVDDTHAYYRVPQLGFILSYDRSIVDKVKNGKHVPYMDIYDLHLKKHDAPWLFKSGCKPGGIKVPLKENGMSEYQIYYHWCPVGTRPISHAPAGSVEAMQSSAVGRVTAAIVNKSLNDDISTYLKFKKGSEIDSYLSDVFPSASDLYQTQSVSD